MKPRSAKNQKRRGVASRRSAEAEALMQVARLINEPLDVDRVCQRIVQSVLTLLSVKFSAITLLDPDGRLRLIARGGEPLIGADWGDVLPSGTGVTGRAVQQGAPFWSRDVRSERRVAWPDDVRARLVSRAQRALLAVPLQPRGRTIGALTVADHDAREFAATEIKLVQAFADHAALAIDNARLYQETAQRRREAEGLAEISQTINMSLDVQTVLRHVVENARALCGSDMAGVALREPGSERAVIRYVAGARGDWNGAVIEPGRGSGGTVLLTGQPFRTEAYPDDHRIDHTAKDPCAADGVEAQVVAPIRRHTRIVGLLFVGNRAPRPFTDRDVQMLGRLAQQAAVAIHNAHLFAEQAQTEAALRGSERSYRLLAENMADVVMLFDLEMRQLYVSPSVLRLRGFTPEESIRQSMGERMTPASAAAMAEVLGEEIALEASGQGDPRRFRTMEIELRHRDGSAVWVETTATFLRDDAGRPTGIIAVSRSIADRKRTEAALRETEARLHQAERIEAIGRLAGGIAHDFNNLLTIILGRTAAILDKAAPHDPGRRDVELIEATAERAAQLTKRLLTFSRKQVLRLQLLDLNAVVMGIAPMLQRLIGAEFSLLTLLDPSPGTIHADRTQLEQIIVNLVVNARDAMPRGGRITVQTASVDLDDAFVAANPEATAGSHARLTVSDTGTGMTAEVRAQIFEPFFTTKEAGKGTGLGLATVHGIVKQHGGFIAVESTPGMGTLVQIYLKHSTDAPPPAR
jgi:PAS domain S-box-containing protein